MESSNATITIVGHSPKGRRLWMKFSKYLLPVFLALVMFGGFAAAAATPGPGIPRTPAPSATVASGLVGQLCQIKDIIKTILPTVALIMLLLAGLVYAAGQAFGAEMKAKAQGWAMALLVGAIIGLLLAVLAPSLVDIFAGAGVGLGTRCP